MLFLPLGLCFEDGRDDPYLRLSNGNRIEMDAYIEDAANYPAYSAFTKYILEEKGFVSPEKREYLTYRCLIIGDCTIKKERLNAALFSLFILFVSIFRHF